MNVSAIRMSLVFLILTCVHAAWGAESIEAQLKRVADETRKNLPMMVSENLQATNIAAVGKTLLHRYNFTTKSESLLNLTRLKAEYYGNSVNAACTNPTVINMLKQGVSLLYEYYDFDNKFVMQYSIDKSTCGR